MKKTLVATIDATGVPEWTIRALMNQMKAWIDANRRTLPFEDILMMPMDGPSRLYWLEGEHGDPADEKALEEIRDRLKPLLEVALDLRLDRANQYVVPKRFRSK